MSTAALNTLFPQPRAAAQGPHAPSPNGASPEGSGGAEEPFLVRLDRMSPGQRLRAYRDGTFSRQDRARWATRYPEEVPTVNGEVEWIALSSADLD